MIVVSKADVRPTQAATVDRQVRPSQRPAVEVPGDKGWRSNVPILPLLFIATLFVAPEANFAIGPILLTGQRVILIIVLLPCIALMVMGRAGRLQLCDWLMFGHACWVVVSLAVNHGAEVAAESGAIYFIEFFGSYVIARTFIRTESIFRSTILVLALALCVLPLFTFPEAVTGHRLLRNVWGPITGQYSTEPMDMRMGLYRAFGPFQHPILYGVCSASCLGMTWFMLRKDKAKRRLAAVLLSFGTFLSLSSGPLAALSLQWFLILWEKATRRVRARWYVLGGLFVAAYLGVSLLSNRDPIAVFISYATFSPHNGYYRRAAWEYGIAEVQRHPVFGIGMNDWIRAEWMYSSSIDNFWLATAMKYGVPGFASLAGAVGLIAYRVARETSVRDAAPRLGWLISIAGVVAAASTVHLWGTSSNLFCFLLGAAAGSLTVQAETTRRARRVAGPSQLAHSPSRGGA